MRQSSRAIVVKDTQILLMKRNKFGKEFYSLVGGAIEPGEKPVDAVIREVSEETTLIVSNPRLVIIEDAGDVFGIQYIFLCDYVSGEPTLQQGSVESKITVEGKNTYQPVWEDITELENIRLLPVELKTMIISYLKEGFPDKPSELKIENLVTS